MTGRADGVHEPDDAEAALAPYAGAAAGARRLISNGGTEPAVVWALTLAPGGGSPIPYEVLAPPA